MTKRIFVAATRQNEGKTTVSLGLIAALNQRGCKIGFIKPVGQRYVESDGVRVDEDAYLIEQVCNTVGECNISDMSPVTVGRDFTRKYLDEGDAEPLRARIVEAYERVAQGMDVVIIEGTGHAGVGSVFDLSNATVARLLESKVIIVSSGGIGRPVDEIALNQCLFQSEGVPMAGAIINRVIPEKLESVKAYVQKALARKGTRLLGALPLRERLSNPTISQVLEEIGGKLLNGEENIEEPIDRVVIGSMAPHNALNFFGKGVLALFPGDRDDLILAAMSSCVMGIGKAYCVSGIVLTTGVLPHKNIMRLVKRTQMPIIAVDLDIYTTASRIHDLIVKIRPVDKDKIDLASRLVEKHIDIDGILAQL